MTSKVIIQVDRLASSLVVDNNVASTTSATSSSLERQQSVQEQHQQLPSDNLVIRNNNHLSSSPPTQPHPSPSVSISPSPSSSSSYSNSSTSSSSSKNTQALTFSALKDTLSNQQQGCGSNTATISRSIQKLTTLPISDLADNYKNLQNFINSSEEPVKTKKFKETMANDADSNNDSGIPMDGVELDSSSILNNRTGEIVNAINSSSNTLATSSSLTGILANNIPGSQSPLLASNRINISNEATASENPTLWCEDSKHSGYNFNPLEFGLCHNSLPHNSLGPPDNLANTVFSTNQINNNGDVPNAFQTNNHDKNSCSQSSSSSGIRSFGDLFDDDDLD